MRPCVSSLTPSVPFHPQPPVPGSHEPPPAPAEPPEQPPTCSLPVLLGLPAPLEGAHRWQGEPAVPAPSLLHPSQGKDGREKQRQPNFTSQIQVKSGCCLCCCISYLLLSPSSCWEERCWLGDENLQLKGDFEGGVAAGETCCLQTVLHWNLLIVLETTLLLHGARLGWDWRLVTASASLMYF